MAGSGKTYTMTAIQRRAATELFAAVEELRMRTNAEICVSGEYVCMYVCMCLSVHAYAFVCMPCLYVHDYVSIHECM